ncbi:PROPROTEIN CONVERTASE SUBTILISIN/KEXIN [Salix purpurea]|uniref:PROPROTEIN CONVERTASE SUBTILISIN/KEXIN n=1 Tax=Salix purpurea TaxID=77065 RepID=A0A9Q0P0W2_SALPP|nr:PROPROTEIN CONVERTASE SUBTILISIN/KEXIN [Salix purpurea]
MNRRNFTLFILVINLIMSPQCKHTWMFCCPSRAVILKLGSPSYIAIQRYLMRLAAKLSKAEARKLSRREEVLSVFPNRYHKLHTTKSWDFIGLPNTTKRNLKMERNMVVGLLDTGITPKSESFKDDGFGPPPKKWKGTCGHYANFSGCNNKLVGARYFKLDGKPDPMELGNGKIVSGVGVNTFQPKQKSYPLVSGADAGYSGSQDSARFCDEGSLDPSKVKGKLVLCELGSVWGADSVVEGAGGKGIILEISDAVNDYIHSTKFPSAVIYRSQELIVPAPFVASFSSRGPNPGSERILKPDVTAPGIDILASYTPLRSLTGLKGDTQYSRFSLMSGHFHGLPSRFWTSCLHKVVPSKLDSSSNQIRHPDNRVNNDAEFAYGAGQINPIRARNPGLVYDMDEMSYIQFLCREGYNESSLAVLVGSKSINCSSLLPGLGHDALNYPTMQLQVKNEKEPTTGVFIRTVTNVGPSPSVYNAAIKAPKGVEIQVKPASLSFSGAAQKRSFKVVVRAKPMSRPQILSGSLVWKSNRHVVRSPIVIFKPLD